MTRTLRIVLVVGLLSAIAIFIGRFFRHKLAAIVVAPKYAGLVKAQTPGTCKERFGEGYPHQGPSVAYNATLQEYETYCCPINYNFDNRKYPPVCRLRSP